MIVKDITLSSPEENILYDEVLLQLAEAHDDGDVLRFWESAQVFIVLGRIGKEEEALHQDNIAIDHVPVLRRSSGGGTVVQGPGCLNYTFILSKERYPQLNDIRQSYVYILGRVVEALKGCGLAAEVFPISDIALAENHKKISGNAQKRGKKYILHHGTILCHFDLAMINRYLKMPKIIPDYRRERAHMDFVTNAGLDQERIKEALQRIFLPSRIDRRLSSEEVIYLNKCRLDRKGLILISGMS